MIEITRYPAVQTFVDPMAQRRVTIEARPDGTFQFVGEYFYGDPADDDDHIGWQTVSDSGIYDSASAAEREAIADHPWISEASQSGEAGLRRFVVDCRDAGTVRELWRRYLDVTRPEGAELFGRNLDAFWDALAGGPGWPGDCELIFRNTDALTNLETTGAGSFLDALRKIAADSELIRVLMD